MKGDCVHMGECKCVCVVVVNDQGYRAKYESFLATNNSLGIFFLYFVTRVLLFLDMMLTDEKQLALRVLRVLLNLIS